MIAVYYRVSTDMQDFDSQKHEVERWMTAKFPGVEYKEYCDVESGSSKTRPQYQRLCDAVEDGVVRTVVCYRLDRLGRDSITVLRLLLDWMQRGVEFFATAQPILQLGKDNPMRLTIISLFSELAQIERETLIARVKAGIEARRAKGLRVGGIPKLTDEQVEQARELRVQNLSYRKIAARFDVDSSTIMRYLKKKKD